PIMRTMGGRPVLMQRYPHGATGSSFFQKRVPDNAPEWLETTIVSTPNGTTSRALVAVDLAHIAWAVNLGCLGFHVWPAHAADPDHADELRIDLDPQPGTRFDEAREAAADVRALFDESGIVGHPKTTGNRCLRCRSPTSPAGSRTRRGRPCIRRCRGSRRGSRPVAHARRKSRRPRRLTA